MDVRVEPGLYWGKVNLPASKAEMHRKNIMGAFAKAKQIEGFDDCDDTKASFDAAYTIMKTYADDDNEVHRCQCNSSAATLRMLLPIAGISGKKFVFEGSEQLATRPVKELLDELRKHGMTIEGDSLPITVSGKLQPGEYKISGETTSQYISGLLMALPMLDGDSSLDVIGNLESKAYVDMTLQCLKDFRIEIGGEFGHWKIQGNQNPVSSKVTLKCEKDWGVAANYIVANYFGSKVTMEGLSNDSMQADSAIFTDLQSLGKEININETPDIAPILAVAACKYNGITTLTGARRLKYKESNRIKNTVDMINALGGKAEGTEDSIIIYGNGKLKGGVVDPKGDHRIAMAATIAAQICENDVEILGANCVSKSCPNFFKDSTSVGAKIHYYVR